MAVRATKTVANLRFLKDGAKKSTHKEKCPRFIKQKRNEFNQRVQK